MISKKDMKDIKYISDNKIKTREDRIKIADTLTNSIAQLLYICDVYGASETLADLMVGVTTDEKEGIISSKEAKDFKINALRLFDNAKKSCKCFEIKDIF